MTSTHAGGTSGNPYAQPNDPPLPTFRRKRARRAALRYLFVWSVVAALALIAQIVAPVAAT